MDQLNPFVFLILSFGQGLLSAQLAKKRGRNTSRWFFFGFTFGLLAIVALYCLPRLKNVALPGKLVPATNNIPVIEPAVIDEVVVEHNEGITDKNWYFLDGAHAIQGPVGFLQLYDACQKQTINEQTYVWTEGMSDWQRIETLSALKEELNLS